MALRCFRNINLAKKQGAGRVGKKSQMNHLLATAVIISPGTEMKGAPCGSGLKRIAPEKNRVGVAKRRTSPSAAWPDCFFWQRCGPTHFFPIFFPPKNAFAFQFPKALLSEFKQHLTAWPSNNKWCLVARLLVA